MKHLTTTLFLFLFCHLGFTQGINLNVGDKFEYQLTHYSTYVDTLNGEQTKQYEFYTLISYKFKVTESTKSGYQLECFHSITDIYDRQRNGKNSQWETIRNNHNELYNEQTSLEKNMDAHFMVQINNKGEISNLNILNYASGTNKKNRKYLPSKKNIEQQFTNFLNTCFVNLPNKISAGDIITLENDKYKLECEENGLFIFSTDIDKKVEYSTTATQYSPKEKITNNYTGKNSGQKRLVIDKNTGLVKEQKSNFIQKLIVNNDSDRTRTSSINHREVCLFESHNDYNCISINDSKEDSTTLYNTNVRIRGKILNPDKTRSVSLRWRKIEPMAYKKMGIITSLKDDNTFEIRLHIDKMKYVDFVHKEKSSFYLMPGDDIYLEVDMNAFDETIHATGVGASHINLCLKTFLYDEQHQSDFLTLYSTYRDKTISATPAEMKHYLLSTLADKQAFLSTYSEQVAPEVFQALYWDTQCNIALYLKNYPTDQWRRRPQQGLKSYHIDHLSYANMDSLIHPDNDLMAFSRYYDHFIREYVFFFLGDRMEKICGFGNTVYKKDFYGNTYKNNYYIANTFFTGKTQESLKYSTVEDALDNCNFSIFENLYLKYKSDYPHSSKIKLLDNAYYTSQKTKTLSPAYNFSLKDLEGNTHQLSDYKGKAVYLRFWNLGCGTDGYSEKNYNELQDSIKNTDIVYIHIFTQGNAEKAKAYINKYNLKGLFLIAPGQTAYLLKREYYFNNALQYFLIDSNGNIVPNKRIEPYELLMNLEVLEDAFNPPLNSINYEQRSKLMTIISLGLLALLILAGFAFIWIKKRNKKHLKIANLNQQLRESELKALRTQMNPHFLHNCLNAIQNLIQKQELEKAHQYISKFAQLIRDTLTHSDKEEISLAQEIEMIQNYVSLEQLRYEIDFQIQLADNINIYTIFIPPMLLQPIVENAIIHGLAHKKKDKQLSLSIYNKGNIIHITITDNGIGREANKQLNNNGTGKGTSFTKERLNLLSQKYDTTCQMIIEDLYNEQQKACGTKVEIIIEDED